MPKKPKSEKNGQKEQWQQKETSFTVDKERLDEEWVNQPDLFHEFAIQLADARLELEEAKAELDVVAAELDRDIRERPNKFGLDKFTETAVKNTVLTQQAYKAQVSAVNKARHRMDIVQAAVTACDHRKKALENLVYLHGQDYFSTPRARGEDATALREADDKKRVYSRTAMTRESLREDAE
jgi:hypothetical protein